MEKTTIEKTKVTWIDKRDRMPTEDDADRWLCVLAWSPNLGCTIVNWQNFENYGGHLTHWARMPERPEVEEC